MNRPMRLLPALVLLALCIVPANIFSCANMVENRFVNKKMPEVPQQPFVDGKLGILWPGYQRRYLVIAYRYLDHKPLSADERASLEDRMKPVVLPSGATEPDSPVTIWLKARSQALGVRPVQKIDIYTIKANGFSQYPNCGDDAFTNAAATVAKRAQKFGVGSAAIHDWVSGQDAVFMNCGSADDFRWRPPDQPRPPKILYEPRPVTLDNALLKYDRQYQVAAANFYFGDFDRAAGDFQSIAHQPDSPWRAWAPYLVARSYVRKATIATTGDESFNRTAMVVAQDQLRAILVDKTRAPVHPAAQNLLHYVEARLDPQQRAHAIALELMSGVGSRMKDELFDYTFLLDHILEQQTDAPGFADKLADFKGPATSDAYENAVRVESWRSAAEKNRDADDLTDWVLTFQLDGSQSNAHRYERWQATKSQPWLISTLVTLPGDDPHAAEVVHAAESIGPESPAYDTALYHRVRLLEAQKQPTQARQLLDANWQRIEKQAPSDRNAFLAQRFAVAQNFTEFLQFAPRTPLELSDLVGKHSYYCFQGTCGGGSPQMTFKPPPQRLELDSVNVFNQDLPHSMLVQAAGGTTLPPELRSELAARAWLRAALLDDTSVTRQLEPQVLAAYPEFRSYLESYDQADSPAARQFALVFMVMHFAGMQPFLNSGAMGSVVRPGIDSYGTWWCYDVGSMQGHRPQQSSFWSAAGSVPSISVQVGDDENSAASPAWLSKSELAQGRKEAAQLTAIGAAPLYFARVVLDWAKAHPDDPRVPEALHYFVRSTRYGCIDKSIGPDSRRAFDLLHRRYPNSEWAKKTPYWFG